MSLPSPSSILITGASSGIGKEFARLFAQGGNHLILTARDTTRLHELKTELEQKYASSVTTIIADLTTAEGRQTVVHAIQTTHIDILINNAGFGLYGSFDTLSLEEQRNMINVNILALTELAHAAITGMKRRGAGTVLNVASTAAFLPGPLMSVYYASKAYVLSLSEALQNECVGTGVRVSVLCPGPTGTGFSDRAGLGISKLFQGSIMDAQRVAQEAYDGIKQHKTIITPGLKNYLLTKFISLVPRSIVPHIVRRAQEKRDV